MDYTYNTKGVCATSIKLKINDGVLTDVFISGGCNGNGQGICRLLIGMKTDEVVKKLEGIKCGFKSTSCPDQMAKAIKAATGVK